MTTFEQAAANMPSEWFVDDRRPQDGEIWEDAEGVLYTVSGSYGVVTQGPFLGATSIGLWAFALGEICPIHRDTVTKPLARAFDVTGKFVLQRPLRYPNHSNIVRH